jgi:hypothetical protein
MKTHPLENSRNPIGERGFFKLLALAALALAPASSAASWVHGKVIQTVEVGMGYVQIQSTESSNFNYYYKASDANNPGNTAEGMKNFLALVLSAQASGSPVNLLVSNPGEAGQYVSAGSIGTMK